MKKKESMFDNEKLLKKVDLQLISGGNKGNKSDVPGGYQDCKVGDYWDIAIPKAKDIIITETSLDKPIK